VFLFEQEGAYVVRLHHAGQAGSHHTLAEFTRDDIQGLVAQGPTLRGVARAVGAAGTHSPASAIATSPDTTPADPGLAGSEG
jgi:hypothetical protein